MMTDYAREPGLLVAGSTEREFPVADGIDRAMLLETFDGDGELLREIVGIFLEDCPKRLAALHEALAHHDSHALEWAAHSIKGSIANFAASAAVRAALKVELMARDGDLTNAEAACAVLGTEVARVSQVLARLMRSPLPLHA